MDDWEESGIGTADRAGNPHDTDGLDGEGLPSLEVIEQLSLADVRRHLEKLAHDRLRAGIGPEATVRYHALCRREDELLRGAGGNPGL